MYVCVCVCMNLILRNIFVAINFKHPPRVQTFAVNIPNLCVKEQTYDH